METQKMRRISVTREFGLLLRQGWRVLLGNKLNLTISLLFPFMAAAVAVWVAGKDMYNNFESTKSACFILVCAAIWGGLFNSIQVVVKERQARLCQRCAAHRMLYRIPCVDPDDAVSVPEPGFVRQLLWREVGIRKRHACSRYFDGCNHRGILDFHVPGGDGCGCTGHDGVLFCQE